MRVLAKFLPGVCRLLSEGHLFCNFYLTWRRPAITAMLLGTLPRRVGRCRAYDKLDSVVVRPHVRLREDRKRQGGWCGPNMASGPSTRV